MQEENETDLGNFSHQKSGWRRLYAETSDSCAAQGTNIDESVLGKRREKYYSSLSEKPSC